MKTFIEKCLGMSAWKKEWQESLSSTLADAQKGLGVSMVVVIARESDLYAEVLFLLSFLGLILGAVAAYFLKEFLDADELLLLPVLGFALGSTFFAFRKFFINRIAPRAIRDRVAGRAKAVFFDHHLHLKGRLVLLYLSELEREALFLASPELLDQTPSKEIQSILSNLIVHYRQRDPMKILGPALIELGQSLRPHFGSTSEADVGTAAVSYPRYVGASDLPAQLRIPLLKGSKDIN